MGEFLNPQYSDWLDEYNKVPWWGRRSPKTGLQSVFFTATTIIGGPLDLPSHRDYYQPERAAKILEGVLYSDLSEQKRAEVAYVTWMAQQELPTGAMGIELCKGLVSLARELRLPKKTLRYIEETLNELGVKDHSFAMADMVREAFMSKTPLADKLLLPQSPS